MRQRLLHHMAFWFIYWLVFSCTYSRYDGDFKKYACTVAVGMPCLMVATYLVLWSIDRWSLAWKAFVGAFAALFLGGLLTRLLKKYYLVPVWFPDSQFDFWSYRLISDVLDCTLVAGIVLSMRLYFRQQASIQHAQALRAEKSEAELRALKGQLQPHFLFNTINNLYALARIKSDKTAPVALHLAQLLRYVIYDAAAARVKLSQEIKLLEDFIELEKMRFDKERLSVHKHVEIADADLPIAPLLLLPLVENAFKHGVSEQRDGAVVRLSVIQKDRDLTVEVQNSFDPNNQQENKGIGLQNLHRQLELLYPNNSQVETWESDMVYHARLRLWKL
jgi:two-component system, LytTR family, sensor kinase